MNPFFMNQAKQNMNGMSPDNMRMAADMMKNMSDADIQNLMKMTGMNVSPELLKSSANMMAGMSDKDLNNMKNMQGGTQPNNKAPTSSTTSKNSEKEEERSEQSPLFPKIEKLKNQGNEYFKKSLFDQASASYLEAILEIEEISPNQKYKKEELNTLEIACRLNYANVKAKLEDYETVLHQANKVLEFGPNGKAFFRKGQAFYHLHKYNEALESLESATSLLPQDTIITSYLQKTRQAQQELKRENQKTNASTTEKPSSQEKAKNKEKAKQEENAKKESPMQEPESRKERKEEEAEIKSEPKVERVEKEKSTPVQENMEAKTEEKEKREAKTEEKVKNEAKKEEKAKTEDKAQPRDTPADSPFSDASQFDKKPNDPGTQAEQKDVKAPKQRNSSKTLAFALIYALLIIGIYVFKRYFSNK